MKAPWRDPARAIPSREEQRPPPLGNASTRPAARGTSMVLSTTNYMATAAGYRVAHLGGNAIDAGVAAGIALNVVEPHMCNFGGVAPIMMFRPGMAVPETIDGLGRWPQAIDLDSYRAWFGGDIPIGVERSVTPAACDAWLSALARHGTLALADVMAPAIELCERGVVVTHSMALFLNLYEARLKRWKASATTLLLNGRARREGEILLQPELAALLRRLVHAESRARAGGASRSDAIMAARDEFYSGSIADEIAAFFEAEQWPLTRADLAAQRVAITPAVRGTYRGIDVYACGPWCQGPLVPLTLNILDGFDLAGMGQGSADFFHHYAEAMKLAAADREGFFGDPSQIDVPVEALLSAAYARGRRELIDGTRAWPALPPPGDPWPLAGRSGLPGQVPAIASGIGSPDTAYACAMDADGNAFSATPSDHVCGSPMVPGLGIVISHRGGQFWTQPGHPSALAPGKRPRLTPNPGMLMRDGKVLFALGSPGEDIQAQAMVQVICNLVDFGLDIQAAIEAPRVASHSFPWSYHPHVYRPGALMMEAGAAPNAQAVLQARGHAVEMAPRFSYGMGAVCAAGRDGDGLVAGCDPRRDGIALAW
jgi:gamma-glutamyltranspeptidase / glutathione hydrolase